MDFSLINILIILFIFLLSYQLYTNCNSFFSLKKRRIEGMENETTTSYSEYDTNNPNNALILSQQNAGNIAYLKQQVDSLFQMKTTIDDLKEQVNVLNTQVQDIVQQQADFAQQIAGDTPPDVTGTE